MKTTLRWKREKVVRQLEENQERVVLWKQREERPSRRRGRPIMFKSFREIKENEE